VCKLEEPPPFCCRERVWVRHGRDARDSRERICPYDSSYGQTVEDLDKITSQPADVPLEYFIRPEEHGRAPARTAPEVSKDYLERIVDRVRVKLGPQSATGRRLL
jgi:hypothetical protein